MIVKAEVSVSRRNRELRLGRAGRSRFRRVDNRLWGWGLAMKPRLNRTQLNNRSWALGRSRRLRAYPPRLGDSKPRDPAALLRSAQRSARLRPALPDRLCPPARLRSALLSPARLRSAPLGSTRQVLYTCSAPLGSPQPRSAPLGPPALPLSTRGTIAIRALPWLGATVLAGSSSALFGTPLRLVSRTAVSTRSLVAFFGHPRSLLPLPTRQRPGRSERAGRTPPRRGHAG